MSIEDEFKKANDLFNAMTQEVAVDNLNRALDQMDSLRGAFSRSKHGEQLINRLDYEQLRKDLADIKSELLKILSHARI
jgi:hypothetical protein